MSKEELAIQLPVLPDDAEPPPVVMCFSGFDPTGGAGMTADIETLGSQGCVTAGVITALTVQDTRDVISVNPVDPQIIIQQARAVLEDVPVSAFKLGMLGSEENIAAIHSILIDYPDIPMVFDPILASGGSGERLVDMDMIDAMVSLLIPQTSVITPNTNEALALVPQADSINAAAAALLEYGAEYVLATGTHDNTDNVVNTLYGEHKVLHAWEWPRLGHTYHGSGCTLASSLAGALAQGITIEEACMVAQEFTWLSLSTGQRIGMGQHHPNRFYWALTENDDLDAPGS